MKRQPGQNFVDEIIFEQGSDGKLIVWVRQSATHEMCVARVVNAETDKPGIEFADLIDLGLARSIVSAVEAYKDSERVLH